MWITVPFILLFILYALLLFFYRKSWQQMPEVEVEERYSPQTSISVIIAARNEEKNIANCLFSVLEQHFDPQLFEVIVVDDHSEDHTAEIVNRLCTIYSNLSCINLKAQENIIAYKKKAITTGINKAKGKLIVTTDADCIVPENWLKNIAAFYENKKLVFIAAPVVIAPGKGLVKLFQSLDFLSLQGITGASVFAQFHTMCNGANLAYEKKVFEEVNGFDGVDTIASGDDMLLMHKVFLKYPDKVQYLKSKAAIVQTAPANNWAEFFNQRIRWASKAGKYDDKRIFWVLLLVYLFNLSFLIIFITAFFVGEFWMYLISLLLLKTLYELFFMIPVAKFFNKETQLWWFPLMQPLHILYTITAGLLGSITTYTWKGRKVK
ncbi:MAG: glycosyltransferase [Sphingobacteriales bacterium]|nr:MAG: glycosyltransferase [Sphingobacteriales bacterium]